MSSSSSACFRVRRVLRHRWIEEGKLSPFSNLGYAVGPEAFIPYLGDPDSERWPQLSALERPFIR